MKRISHKYFNKFNHELEGFLTCIILCFRTWQFSVDLHLISTAVILLAAPWNEEQDRPLDQDKSSSCYFLEGLVWVLLCSPGWRSSLDPQLPRGWGGQGPARHCREHKQMQSTGGARYGQSPNSCQFSLWRVVWTWACWREGCGLTLPSPAHLEKRLVLRHRTREQLLTRSADS